MTRLVNTLVNVDSFDNLDNNELLAIYKYTLAMIKRYEDIVNFCNQDPTAKGGVSHKNAMLFYHHYLKTKEYLDSRIDKSKVDIGG